MVRRNGVLTRVPPAAASRQIDFGRGPRPAVQIPWGDVSTAYHSTGIPDIEVYLALPPQQVRAMQASRYLGGLLKLPGALGLLTRLVRSGAPGPDAEQRASGRCVLWGAVEDGQGGRAESRLVTPEAYTLTALTSLLIMRKVLAGDVHPGYQTASSAYGPDLILEIPGVERVDIGI